MRRKLTLAMLLSLSAASSQALALGVGEVDVRSSLNAPLRAVIPLTDTAGLDPELMRVSVADPREFESAGLLRTPLAASVRADVEVRQGQWVVTLASERAVREPWMDLMLSFDWPSGRQLREITLLLDPPDYDSMPVLVSGSSRQPAPRARSTGEDRTGESETVASPSSVAPVGSQAGRAWVGSGDTLWSVAGRLRPDSGISMNQMMVALVEANPDVFPSGNINAMRAGHNLVVPSRDAIATRTAEEASGVVQAMNQAWASRGSGGPARVPLGPSTPTGDSMQLATAAPEQAVAEPSATLAMPESADQGEAAIPMLTDEPDSTPRLTLLSDEELAAETSERGASDDEATNAAVKDEAVDGALDASVLAVLDAGELVLGQTDPRFALLEQRWQESRAALEEVQAERDTLEQEIGGLRDEVEAMREQLAMLLASGTGAQGAGSGSVGVPPDADEQAEAPWWGAMYPAYDRNLILGGAGLAALLGLWLWVRRRQRRDAAAAMGSAAMPSMVHGMPPSPAAPSPNAPSAVMPPMVAGMTVGTTEAKQAEAPRPSMPQAEAINEADIFMAYGRYDQAREMLEASLARDPGRHDLRLKLLNVHVEQSNWQAAEGEMQVLAETGDSGLLAEAARLMARHHGGPGGTPDGAPEAAMSGERETPQDDDAGVTGELSLANAYDSPLRGVESDLADAEEAHHEDGPASSEEAAHDSTLAYVSFPQHELPDERHAAPAEVSTDNEQWEREEERSASPAENSLPEPPSQPGQEDVRVEWEVIDYQPPPLDPKPAPRVETPMQPSVDFPLMDDAAGKRTAEKEPESSGPEEPSVDADVEWEVEEVAFPPLDPDNSSALGESARRDDLAEARRLLENGETERVRPLLQRLLDGAEEPRLRDEVQALITHYRL